MENLFDLLNIYPHPISLSHNKKWIFHTFYGLVFSFISYIFIIYMIYYFSYDLFKLKNPKIRSFHSDIDKNFSIQADKIFEEFNILLEINYNTINQINSRDSLNHNITIRIKSFDSRNNKFEIYSLNTGNFKYKKLISSNFSFSCEFYNLITNETEFKYFIISDGVEQNQNITKKFKDIYFKIENEVSIDFGFNLSDNVLNYTIIKADFYYRLYDYYVNNQDFNKKSYNLSSDGFIGNNDYVHIFYKIIEIDTDSNPFFSNFLSDYFTQIDYLYTRYIQLNYFDYRFEKVFLNIQFKKIKDVYLRVYKKFLDVLSELGGIFNPIIILGKILVLKLNEKKFKIDVLNQLFCEDDIHTEVIPKFHKNKFNFQLNKRKFGFINNNIFDNRKFELFCRKNKPKLFEKNHKITFYEMQNIKEKYNYHLDNESSRPILEQKQSLNKNLDLKNLPLEELNYSNSIHNQNKISQINKLHINNLINQNRDFSNNPIYNQSKSDLNKAQYNNHNQQKEINQNILLKQQNIKNKINTYLSTLNEKKDNLLYYSFSDILKSKFLCRKLLDKNLQEKEEIYDKIIIKLNYYLEITNIMRLYENLEKMKFILFNKNQIDCFKYMIHDINYNNNEKEEDILFELTRYFNKPVRDNIDESINILMKKEIKKILIEEDID